MSHFLNMNGVCRFRDEQNKLVLVLPQPMYGVNILSSLSELQWVTPQKIAYSIDVFSHFNSYTGQVIDF
jgi:hypothetical protein